MNLDLANWSGIFSCVVNRCVLHVDSENVNIVWYSRLQRIHGEETKFNVRGGVRCETFPECQERRAGLDYFDQQNCEITIRKLTRNLLIPHDGNLPLPCRKRLQGTPNRDMFTGVMGTKITDLRPVGRPNRIPVRTVDRRARQPTQGGF